MYFKSLSLQADAEEMCHILQEAFQLVYTEATMEHFTDSISAGERGRGSTAPRSSVGRNEQDSQLNLP